MNKNILSSKLAIIITILISINVLNTNSIHAQDTDSDGIIDTADLDDDNDGILDTIENGSNLLIDGGFDSLSPPLFGNNIGTVSIAPWVRESGVTANVILVDGAGGSTYGAGGPEFDASGGAGNYFDVYGSGVIYQTFTLATNTIVSYGGYFSARDGLTGNGSIAIYSGTGSGGTLMGSSGTITTSDNTDWTFTTNTLALVAGTYSFVVTLDNPINFDQGFVYNVDVDGDGIINALDLDSDADGCPDALEGASNITYLSTENSAIDGGSTNVQYNLGDDVDSDGVPYIAIGGQGIGTSRDNTTENSECLDSDTDGLRDYLDLDDDNDGILDLIECPKETIPLLTGEFNGTFGTLVGGSRPLTNPVPGFTYKTVINATASYAVTSYTGSVAIHTHAVWDNFYGHTTGLANDAYLAVNGDTTFGLFFSETITLKANTIYNAGFWAINATVKIPSVPNGNDPNIAFRIIRVSDGETVLSSDSGPLRVIPLAPSTDITPEYWTEVRKYFNTGAGTVFRYELFNITQSVSANDFAVDDLYISERLLCDEDGDLIPNTIDLDSDADNCPDALEGANNINYLLLKTSSMSGGSTGIQVNLGNAIDYDGTPFISQGGQAIGSSLDNTTEGPQCLDSDNDTVRDYIDIDDDNDGVLDITEGIDTLEFNFDTTNEGWVEDNSNNGTTGNSLSHSSTGNIEGNPGDFCPIPDALQAHIPSSGYIAAIDYSAGIIFFQSPTFTPVNMSSTINKGQLSFIWANGYIGSGSFSQSSTSLDVVLTDGTTSITATFDGTGEADSIWRHKTLNLDDATWSGSLADLTTVLSALNKISIQVETIAGPGFATNCNGNEWFALDEVVFTPWRADTDNDATPNTLDLDSDGDTCPDAIESATQTALQNSGTNANDGITDNTDDAIINTTLHSVGTNGYANSLEDVDTNLAVPVNAFIATNYATYATDNNINGCGIPMITQMYRNGSEQWIELTNQSDSKVLVPYGANLNLFSGGTTTANTATAANTNELSFETSMLFKSTTTTLLPAGNVTSLTKNEIASISNTNDIISISRSGLASSSIPWESRIDLITNVSDKIALVRSDDILAPNKTYTNTEWVTFVDDALDPYTNPPERHPHAPLLSEIVSKSANTLYNIALGKHRFGTTTRTESNWDNGSPDRSREVIIDEDYSLSTTLSARKLEVSSASKLAITDNLLVVSDDITLTSDNDEIRLLGSAQLVQTHTGTEKITGSGKLLIDRDSPTPSKYRYNYFSSPVNTSGSTNYTVENVLKDGSTALNATGTVGSAVAKDITFVSGYDGDNTTDPIKIADYWVYTYPSAAESYWNWTQTFKDGAIPQTDGFIMKGPGATQNYTFVGTPKDGNLSTTIGAGQSYLIGNPFSSAMSVKKFIEDNTTAITGTLYFWQHNGELNGSGIYGHYYNGYIGGYGTRNIAMGVAADVADTTSKNLGTQGPGLNGGYDEPEPYVPVGQGFFVKGSGTGGTIVFNNSQREFKTEVTGTSLFFKNNKNTLTKSQKKAFALPIIKLGANFKNEQDLFMHKQIGISFHAANSFDFNVGYDSEVYTMGTTELYWKFPNDDKNYVIAGVQEISKNLEIPLEIVMAKNGALSIEIDEIEHVDYPVFIKDKLLNKTYSLDDNNKVDLNLLKGTYTDRFYLVFTESNEPGMTLSTDENHNLGQDIQVYIDKKTNDILVENNGELKIEKIILHNILGKKIKQWDTLEQSEKYRLAVKNTASQVYIITIQTNNGSFSKKIINPGKKVVLQNPKELPEDNNNLINPELKHKPSTGLTSTIQVLLD